MFGFLIAAGAGFLTPQLQASLGKPIAEALVPLKITPDEYPVVGFMIALLVAAVAATLFHSGSVLGIAVGLCVGYFGKRLIAIVQDAVSGKPPAS